MPVEHSDPEKVQLQEHQQVRSESAPKVGESSYLAREFILPEVWERGNQIINVGDSAESVADGMRGEPGTQ